MSWKNSFALAAMIVATGLALSHLVNLSMAMKRCVKPPGALCRGPTMLRPQTANGQVIRMVLQLLRRHVYLSGEVLASLAFTDDFVCVYNSSRRKEALPISLTDQCSCCGVISTD